MSPIVELDLVGPLTAFDLASAGGAPTGLRGSSNYRVTIATAAPDGTIGGRCGLELRAQKHYSEIVDPIDTLVVVGSPDSISREVEPELIDWLRQTRIKARRTASIGAGAYLLAAAGLLDGQRAATHWAFADEMQKRYPKVHVDAERIWVMQDSVYTSAGVTAGIDLALALVEEDLGSRIALESARSLVVFLKRPGGQGQFSAPLNAQLPSTKSLGDLVAWIADNLRAPLTIDALARHMAMSPRNFARVFRAEIGLTPGVYVRRARLETARALLEQTREGLSEIASRCGFGDDEVMRRAFVEDLGVTPGHYRATFDTSRVER